MGTYTNRLDKTNSMVHEKNNLKVSNLARTATIKLFSANSLSRMNFSGDFTSWSKKNDFWTPHHQKKIWKSFFVKNINMDTWTNRRDELRTFFDIKNWSEFVPYPNKEHYLRTVYITILCALFGYGTESDEFLISKNVLNSSRQFV